MTDGNKINLAGLTLSGLTCLFEDLGEKPFRASQVMKWIHQRGVTDINLMSDISKVLRERLHEIGEIRLPDVRDEFFSTDGSRKWIVEVASGSRVEMVYIPEEGRGTLCISSQAGCSLDCTFCATGKQGFDSNLSVAEIIGQLWWANKKLGNYEQPGNHPVSNIVMMGMGEPLYNFEGVRDGILTMSDDAGLSISKRKITLSTSGIVPKIKMAGDEIGSMLAISLHATNNDLRDEIVPINKKYPIEELLEACRNYPGLSNSKRITFEYVMLKGVNDSEAEARDLVKLISGIPAKINLIPFNSWPGSSYECSDWDQIEKFGDIVNRGGYASPIRMPRGEDISAACGQLKSDTKKVRASEKYKKELAKIESKRIGRL